MVVETILVAPLTVNNLNLFGQTDAANCLVTIQNKLPTVSLVAFNSNI